MKNSFLKKLSFCTFLYLCYFIFSLDSKAGSVSSSCKSLFPKSSAYEKKCQNHSRFFDTKSDFIDKCKERFSDQEERMSCLRSGAEITIFQLCNSLKWDNGSTLDCLRYYPTEDLKKECLKFSKTVSVQLQCLKEGREADRVRVCRIKFDKEEERIPCLTNDLFPKE